MRSAIVENGAVTNVIVGEIEGSIPCPEDVSVGWFYNEGEFVSPPTPEPEPVPMLPLQKWRFETMVDMNGLREGIDRAIEAMPEPQRTVAFNKRNHVPEFYRDDPLFDALGPALDVTPEQIDQMWEQALDL